MFHANLGSLTNRQLECNYIVNPMLEFFPVVR